MNNIMACIQFFKDNVGFDRFMRLLRKNYEKHGYFYGNITLEKVSSEERDCFSGFMKKDYKNSKTITVNLIKFINRFQETKYNNIKLENVLSGYFNMEIVPSKTIISEYMKRQDEIFHTIIKKEQDGLVGNLVIKMLNRNSRYYQMIHYYYQRETEDTFIKTITSICSAIRKLPTEKIRLAVFAASITKNPHFFDLKTATGKLFVVFLASYYKVELPRNTEKISELFYYHNILLDDVSNMVLVYNIQGYIKEKDGVLVPHKGWNGFFENKEPIQITLYHLSKIHTVKTHHDKVLVVENPNVFTAILDSDVLRGKKFSMICTYGQVKLSGLVLLDILKDCNTQLYYSGDIDPEGISIADRLSNRYHTIELVGFDKKNYMKNMSDMVLSDSRLKMLDKIKSKQLQEVSLLVKEHKRAAYEEMNIENIIQIIQDKLLS